MTTTGSVTISTSHSTSQTGSNTANGKCQCGCAGGRQTCCQLDCIVQPRFFSGQLLTDQDLTTMLDWAQDRFRLTRYRHGWGVACGLDVHCDPQHGDRVVVGPGYAVDCCGDDIVVCQAATVDLSAVCRDGAENCADWKQTPADAAEKINIGGREIALARLRIVDLYIQYRTEESDPQLVTGTSACRSSSKCEATRTRESFSLTWRKATVPDPMAEAARHWREIFGQTLEVIDAFRRKFPSLSMVQGEEVRRWLLCWIDDHPLHQFCFLRSHIKDEMDVEIFRSEARIAGFLFWMIQDWRSAFLRCACFGCEENQGVPLARIYIQVRDDANKADCRVLAVDPYPPYRRPLGGGCWPAPLGQLNLAQFIGRRWQQVCRELDERGVLISGVKEYVPPPELFKLKESLDCDPFVSCADLWRGNVRLREDRVVEVYEFPGFGKRVVGICARGVMPFDQIRPKESAGEPESAMPAGESAPAAPADQPRISVQKDCVEDFARPGQRVNYLITIRNTGATNLTLKVNEKAATGDVVLEPSVTLAPEQVHEFRYEDSVPPGIRDGVVTNTVVVTGNAPDGRTVTATATHSLPVHPIELTDIAGITAAQADRLTGAGIESADDLARTSLAKLQELFPRTNAEKLKEWISEAKKMTA